MVVNHEDSCSVEINLVFVTQMKEGNQERLTVVQITFILFFLRVSVNYDLLQDKENVDNIYSSTCTKKRYINVM